MHILFVCTGNICRSPMAEGIARAAHPDLATYSSAGTIAVRGSAPTSNAVAAAAEQSIDISDLRATALSKAFTPIPDHIYVMTERHLAKVTAAHSGLADRVQLLDPSGDIIDPYGHDQAFYHDTYEQIRAAIEMRAAEWRAKQA